MAMIMGDSGGGTSTQVIGGEEPIGHTIGSAAGGQRSLPEDRRSRRDIIGAALGGLVAPLVLTEESVAATVVTPNPIKPKIAKSGITVQLVDFCTLPYSNTTRPYALLNFLYHAGDGSGRMFAADSRGKLWAIDGTTGAAKLFLDLKAVRGGLLVADASPKHLGLRSFAFHPDFARAGRPGYRKLYTVNTEKPSGAPVGVPILGDPLLPLHHHDVIAEWGVYSANQSRVDPSSRREVLRIRQYWFMHNTDQLLFNPNKSPGQSGYGAMFIGVGDGKNSPMHTDPYDQAQNPARPLGKILRIDPLKRGSASYSIPADNPFVARSGYLPEIYALGLRHPENLCFDRGGNRDLIITDIGQAQVEEINLGVRGGNYGWPAREGTFATNRLNQNILYTLPTDDTKNGFIYPVAQYDHDEGVAITGGFVYRGAAIPALNGQFLFGDIVNGRVFHVAVAALRLGARATIHELTLLQGGKPVTLRSLLGTIDRVDLRFGQDQAGELYILTKQDAKVRKLH